jgi:predicted porin
MLVMSSNNFRLALSVLAAACAMVGASNAHADQKLYGTLDLSLSTFRISVPKGLAPVKRQQKVDSGDMTPSYIGFSGTEKLNDDLSAQFTLEAYLQADTGATDPAGFWGRNANVALTSNSYGSLKLGRSRTVFFDTLTAFNPFGESGLSPAVAQMADTRATAEALYTGLISQGQSLASANSALNAITARAWSNSVSYQSPDYDGLSAAVQMGMKEGDANGGNHAVALRVNKEEFQAGFAYQSIKTGLPADQSAVNSRWLFGASYDFTVLTAYAEGGQDRYQLNVAGETGAIRSNFLQFGAKVPTSERGEALVSLGRSRNKPLDATSMILSLGYDHHLSPRTDAYALLLLDKAELAGAKGDMGTSLSLGMRHRY